MALTCMRMRDRLFEVLAGRAEEAGRLELELHLQECGRCRRDHAALEGLRQLHEWEPPSLSNAARENVRRAALAAATKPARAQPAARRWTWPAAGLALACAGAATLLLALRPAPRTRVLDGDVVVAATADGARLSSERGGHVQLDGPRLGLAAGSAATWRADRRTLELQQGRLEIDGSDGRPFAVVTSHFRVEVAAAVFVLGDDEVVTASGVVHVRASDGAPLTDVAAGQRWHWNAPASAAAPPTAPHEPAETPPTTSAPATAIARPAQPHGHAHHAAAHADNAYARAASTPLAARAPSAAPSLPATSSPSSAPPPASTAPAAIAPAQPAAATPAAAPPPTAGERVERARKILAHGDAAGARALLSPLPTGELAAEAQVLTAESYLIEGRYQLAVDNYRLVLRRFAASPQAESALYAIAQLHCERDSRSDAVRSLREYLDRYPQGRFAAEARDRLEKLTRR